MAKKSSSPKMRTDWDINYNDKRFREVEKDKKSALTENKNTYDKMINQSDKYFQDQIDAVKEHTQVQQDLQQQNTEHAINKIEQQKQQSEKDYEREQTGAYVDWQKQSNNYGANAELEAQQGMRGTGYSESSQVSMYNQYQNRVATARESFGNAKLNYDNAIKDAQLQNNSILAEIAFQGLQKELELSLNGFQYKNQMLIDKMNKKQELDQMYHQRYQDVLQQMNQENALREQMRQFNDTFKENRRQADRADRRERDQFTRQLREDIRRENRRYKEDKRQFDKTFKENKRQADRNYKESKRQFDESLKKGSGGAGGGGRRTTYTTYTAPMPTQSRDIKNDNVVTDYYNDKPNSDAKKYGTFSNGYQPKGISGHGKVKATGEKHSFTTYTRSGEKRFVTQNIWKTPDGKLWYWEGRQNKYLPYKK